MRLEVIRLLAPKSQGTERKGKVHNALTPQDVAAALGTADPAAAMLGRLVYADERQWVDDLRREMKLELAGDPRVQRWTLPRPGWLHDLCSLALIEAMYESRMPESHRATFMRISVYKWQRHWRREYERVVVSLLDQWMGHLTDKLSRS